MSVTLFIDFDYICLSIVPIVTSLNYSTLNNSTLNNSLLNSWFITGFSDAESCFSIILTKDKKMKMGWRSQVIFQIHLHKKDKNLLKLIKAALGGVGKVRDSDAKSCVFAVHSPFELASTIIPHFEKYPLITQKWVDFELFKQVVHIIINKEHLTLEGFNRILSIKAFMRNGLTETLAESFQNIVPIAKLIMKTPKYLDPNWIVGFTEGEGCFIVHVQNVPNSKLGKTVKLQFKITQNEKDKEILNLIILSLNCGTLRTDNSCKLASFTRFADIINIIIPFFQKFPFKGAKRRDFADFLKVAKLIQIKKHLTREGLDEILFIKSGMNRGRKYDFGSDE